MAVFQRQKAGDLWKADGALKTPSAVKNPDGG